ncbi:MAG: DinB family protein [Acidimicrobiales bacterium]
MKRVEIESKLNESRNWLLDLYSEFSEEQLHRPLTKSEHDSNNLWSALDHFRHLALIERNFVEMIRRHLSGHQSPVGLLRDEKGASRTREQIMAIVHTTTDRYQRDHHNDPFSQVIALTAGARSATLQLLSELSDEQLEEHLEGAPWADGTLGGVLGTNADHARMHWRWVTEAGLLESGAGDENRTGVHNGGSTGP